MRIVVPIIASLAEYLMKSRRLRSLYYGVLVSLISSIFLPLASARQIPDSVARLLHENGIPLSAVSLDVRHADTGKKILSLNGDKSVNPASVMKILTTLSALEILGPSYQWETRYYADGAIEEGVLKGDLVMQGGGDPFLSVERFWHHVLSLRQRGLHTITGNLIIDNSYFDIPKHNRSAFDNQPNRLYNVGPDAALVNFSASRFVLYPWGNEVMVFADPPLSDLVVDSNIKPKQGKCKSKKHGWWFRGVEKQDEKVIIKFGGTYRVKCGEHFIARSIFSNHEYVLRLFRYLWTNSGGQFAGGYSVSKTPETAAEIISYPSRPLADAITGINKFSNNVMARQLFLSIDAQREVRPGTLEGSRQQVRDWLASNAISMPKLFIDNGSGLSRESRITAGNLSDLLQHGWKSNYRAEFLSSFALSSLDGTMRERLNETELHGRSRIKTGWLRGVRSMAGYVNSRHNRLYTVAMMIQSEKVRYESGSRIQDALLKWIYDL